MTVFQKDENGYLINQNSAGRIGKISIMDFACGLYETQDLDAKDQSLEYNKKAKTKRSAKCEDTKAEIYQIATNPTVRNEEFDETRKHLMILQGLSNMRRKAIREIDDVIEAYLKEYYDELDISMEEIKEHV